MGVILDDLWDHEGYGARRLAAGTHTGMWSVGLGDGRLTGAARVPRGVEGCSVRGVRRGGRRKPGRQGWRVVLSWRFR